MYNIIKAIGVLVRFFYLPNPFQSLPNGDLINFAAEPFIHIITFGVVGLYYESGSNPAVGSFLYTIFYFIHVGLLLLCGFFEWNKVAIIVIAVLYLACHIVINRIKNNI